jgi:hypothetical protein
MKRLGCQRRDDAHGHVQMIFLAALTLLHAITMLGILPNSD